MGKCSACGYSHTHPGEKSCRFTKDAKEKCKGAGEEETRWREFLDVDTLQELAKSEDPASTGQFVSIRDFNELKQTEHDRKLQMDKLESDISNLSIQMTNLLSVFPGPGAAPVVHPSVTLAGVTVPSVTHGTPAIPVSTPVTTATTTSVRTVVTGAALTTSPSTMTSVLPPSTMHWKPPMISSPPVPSIWSTSLSLPHMSSAVGSTPIHPSSVGISHAGGYPPIPHVGGYPPISSAGYMSYGMPASLTSPPASMVPASYLSTPLTPALHGVSDLDPRQPGMMLRPEYHVLHEEEGEPLKQISHKMMTYRKLVHGMVLVAKDIRSRGGDIDSYLSHMDYVTRHGKNEDYQDSAYIEYDRMVVDEFIKNPSAGIKVGNVMASSFCFHDVTRIHKSSSQVMSAKKKKRNKPASRQVDMVPEDYPPDNCFYWNYRSCVMSNCNRNHVCRICGENHRAVNCNHRKQ